MFYSTQGCLTCNFPHSAASPKRWHTLGLTPAAIFPFSSEAPSGASLILGVAAKWCWDYLYGICSINWSSFCPFVMATITVLSGGGGKHLNCQDTNWGYKKGPLVEESTSSGIRHWLELSIEQRDSPASAQRRHLLVNIDVKGWSHSGTTPGM